MVSSHRLLDELAVHQASRSCGPPIRGAQPSQAASYEGKSRVEPMGFPNRIGAYSIVWSEWQSNTRPSITQPR